MAVTTGVFVAAAQSDSSTDDIEELQKKIDKYQDKLDELQKTVSDAIKAVIELYADMKKDLPAGLTADGETSPVWFESLIPAEI